ncbi:helix-turn-helix domain-containing protein [Streptomyces fuscigenes]|uniref:helix-turn-helix domain-containing protein n=1 Tax=Streptomyces fuscigenes TaxID=1528880 RepID=UPI001F3949D2|nr:helix-turn-helix transcriptional regulator [Streptomyces fuscigenes]MCF3961641.1 helix-turn-helix transcriptional regulator [Streptomyces fuscigenes]
MGTAEGATNAQLSEFLRTRRARLSPTGAGLPAAAGAGTRRVPGLRREEVARLAGVSVDYYIRLERGRAANVSGAVLDALARALRLDPAERAHLLALAAPGHRPRRRPHQGPPDPVQRVRPGLLRVLESVGGNPALVLGRRYDVLAANAPARALYTDFEALPVRERNMVRFLFLDPAARTLYADWPAAARATVGGLRLYAGRHADDPLLAGLVAELSGRDADFRRWWAAHEVREHAYGTKHYHHPRVGDLVLGYETLASPTDADQVLGMHTAEAGSPSARALRLLAAPTGLTPGG